MPGDAEVGSRVVTQGERGGLFTIHKVQGRAQAQSTVGLDHGQRGDGRGDDLPREEGKGLASKAHLRLRVRKLGLQQSLESRVGDSQRLEIERDWRMKETGGR